MPGVQPSSQMAAPRRMFWLACLGMAIAAPAQAQTAPAHAQTVPVPHVVAGDSWTFHHKGKNRMGWRESRAVMTVKRADANEIEVTISTPDSDLPPVEKILPADWSRERSVNGHQTVVARPMAFPLSVGKTWKVEYIEDHPNPQHSSEHIVLPYKVTGWEDVTVPAGTFHALKIVAEGEWFAAIAPATGAVASSRIDATGAMTVMHTQRTTPRTVSGRLYRAIWYVPEVKLWVKTDEETFNTNGTRTEYYEDELESYKLAH